MTHTLPNGGWPVMLTPFNANRSIDWTAVDDYTDWLIELGAVGLFAVALSSEMYDLSHRERLDLATRVVERSARRVPVVASSVSSGDASEQALSAAEVASTGVDAVVLISSLIAGPAEPESIWLERAGHIIDHTPGTDFGIYECPLPYKRLASVEAVKWMADSSRFTFFKDTSHSLRVMEARLEVMAGTRLKLYNAAIGSLLPSIALGASGLSGYAANLYPDLVAWLYAHPTSPDATAVHRLLTITEHSVNLRYPASAKYLLDASSRLSFSAISRWKPEPIGSHEGLPLEQLGLYIRDLALPPGALAPAR